MTICALASTDLAPSSASADIDAVAVATGQYPREALLADGPDHFFEDLSDTERVLRAILGG